MHIKILKNVGFENFFLNLIIIIIIIRTRILMHNKQLKKHTIVLKKQKRSIFILKQNAKKGTTKN